MEAGGTLVLQCCVAALQLPSRPTGWDQMTKEVADADALVCK